MKQWRHPPGKHGRQPSGTVSGIFDLAHQVVEKELESRLVLACGASDRNPAVGGSDPDPLVGEEEGDDDAEHHQGASGPDNPDPRVLRHLETGEEFFFAAVITEYQVPTTLFIELGEFAQQDDLSRGSGRRG